MGRSDDSEKAGWDRDTGEYFSTPISHAVPEAKPEPPATKSACDKWPRIREFLPAYPGARNQHPDFIPPHPPANPLSPQEERIAELLQVVQEYRKFTPNHQGCVDNSHTKWGRDLRCLTCRKADKLLAAPKVVDSKEEHGEELDEDELLLCPFCRGEPRWGKSEDNGHFIECSKCGASTNLTYFLMDDASRDVRERWNKRAK